MSDYLAEYGVHFLNQYMKIPKNISEKLDSLYPAQYESVRHCFGLIIVNLLKFKEIAYSRRKNWYTENHTKHYTFANMMNALKIAVADGYAISLKTGYRSPGYEKGRASTIGVGPRLQEFSYSEEMGLNLESLPLVFIDQRPIFGYEDLKLVKAKYTQASLELRDFVNRLDRIYDEALSLNRNYWNKMVIDTCYIDSKCFNRVGLTRIFKKDGFMGRWFQKGGMSYQELPEKEREKLLLNGERVTEIDYSAMHPHILYAWEGKQCPDDFYTGIIDQCGCDRFVAKSIALIAINASSYASLVGAINNNKGETERANKSRAIPEPVLYCELKKRGLTAKEVVEGIKIAHPAIAKYIYSASSNKLMLVESDIMTSALLKLMRLGIPALPVHDSVIVPSRHKDVARRIMQDIYMEHTGFNIVIK